MATAGQNILNFLADDAVLSFGPALITFFTNVGAARGDPIKQSIAWVQLQGDLVGAAPNALAGAENALSSTIVGKLQALLTKAQTDIAGIVQQPPQTPPI